MARLLFEMQGIRRRRGPLASGVTFVVYTDVAGTVLADISATSGGSSIAGSEITTADIDGLGPAAFRFYGPPSGQDTLFLRCPADSSLGVQEIEADEDERLDALEAGGGGGGGAAHVIDPEVAPYSADGTGVADAKAALEAACAAALTLDLPVVARPGRTFKVASTVVIDEDGITIDLQGSVIQKAAALATYAVDVTGDDVTLRNAIIDGNRAAGATGSNVRWQGASGKAYDSHSKSSTLRGWYVSGATASLDGWRLVSTNNVSAVTGIGAGQGFTVGEGGLLRTWDCEASDCDYAGFFLFPTAAAGCRIDGSAIRCAHAGARIDATPGGTIPYFYTEDCNRYGLLLIAQPSEWIMGTIKIRGGGAALPSFELPADGSGACVELFGATDCSIDTVDAEESESYALAFGNHAGQGATRNRVGTVLARGIEDPAVLFSTSANHNSIGVVAAENCTYAVNHGEGSAACEYNVIGTVIADNCTYGAVKFSDGNYNRIDRLVARNIQTFDPVNIGKGVVQFGNLTEEVGLAPTGNSIGWFDYEHDDALAGDPPDYLVHATALAISNRVEGGLARGYATAAFLDDNGGLNPVLFSAPQPTPADQGLVAWSVDPAFVAVNVSPIGASGYTAFVRLRPSRTQVVTTLHLAVGVAGITLTAGQCLAGIYDESLAKVAESGDLSGVLNTTGIKTITLTTSPTLLAGGLYYVAVLINHGGTPPSFHASSNFADLNIGATSVATGWRVFRHPGPNTTLPSTYSAAAMGDYPHPIFAGIS